MFTLAVTYVASSYKNRFSMSRTDCALPSALFISSEKSVETDGGKSPVAVELGASSSSFDRS